MMTIKLVMDVLFVWTETYGPPKKVGRYFPVKIRSLPPPPGNFL